jgi:hypothetical protein
MRTITIITVLLITNFCFADFREKVDRSETNAMPLKIIEGLSEINKGKLALGISKWKEIALNEDEYLANISDKLSKLSNLNGQYIGIDLLRIHSLSKAYHKIFILIRYEKRPVIIQFDTYSSNKNEKYKISYIQIHENIHKKLPKELESNAN